MIAIMQEKPLHYNYYNKKQNSINSRQNIAVCVCVVLWGEGVSHSLSNYSDGPVIRPFEWRLMIELAIISALFLCGRIQLQVDKVYVVVLVTSAFGNF